MLAFFVVMPLLELIFIYRLYDFSGRTYTLDEEGFTVQHFLLFKRRYSWKDIRSMEKYAVETQKGKPPLYRIVWSTRDLPASDGTPIKSSAFRSLTKCFYTTYNSETYDLLKRYFGNSRI